jgi:hypothetical protein
LKNIRLIRPVLELVTNRGQVRYARTRPRKLIRFVILRFAGVKVLSPLLYFPQAALLSVSSLGFA